MIVQAIPYPPAATGIAAPEPILLLSRATTDHTSTTPSQWNTETLDTYGMFTPTSASIVVPAGLNGELLRFAECRYGTNEYSQIQFLLGGSTLNGLPRTQSHNNSKITSRYSCMASAALAFSTGNTITCASIQGILGTAADTTKVGSWVAAEKLDSATKRVKRSKTSTQAIALKTDTTVLFGQEDVNVGGWGYSAGVFTVPSGTTGLVRLSACVKVTGIAVNALQYTEIKAVRNGAAEYGMPFQASSHYADHVLAATSGIIAVSTGDTIELKFHAELADTIENGGVTYVMIEEVSSSIKRCLVRKSASQSYPTGLTFSAIQWDAEVYDTDNIHDNATNNTRLTAPAGTTYGRLTFNVRATGASAGGAGLAQGTKNGSWVPGLPSVSEAESQTYGNDPGLNGPGGWVAMSAGDYFEVMLQFSQSSRTLVDDIGTWAMAEFI